PEIASCSIHWRPDPAWPRMDGHNLNGLCLHRGDLLVSGLGRHHPKGWAGAREGFIYNIDRGMTVAMGLHHPHSILELDCGLAWCESLRNIVHLPGLPPVIDLPGYPRGLCRIGESILVGTSARRKVSRSTGGSVWSTALQNYPGRCTISRIALTSGVLEA